MAITGLRTDQPTLRRLLLGLAAGLGALGLTASSLRAQAAPPGPAVRIDDDGAVHAPAMTVPVSSFLSPEGKAYLTQHLKDMQNPAVLGQNDGVPIFMAGYLATDVPGLWMDQFDADGRGMTEFVPASTLYHVMVAFRELVLFAEEVG